MNYDEILNNIRLLSRGEKPEQDVTELLLKHNCGCLFSKEKRDLKADTLNKICIGERFKACKTVFEAFEEHNIPYAVIKGAVLSQMAYGDPFCRRSGDIDLLMLRDDIDKAKQIMIRSGFVQGRVTDEGIVPFSRRELLFQISASHQTAPFIKKTANPVCPYVNVDVNLDIFWGESDVKADMPFVLKHTEWAEMNGVKLKKLTPELELIALCLHHYKDANSIYLLWQKDLSLSLFVDIYFYLKRNRLNLQRLSDFCSRLEAADFVYYCVYYCNEIFKDGLLAPYLEALKTETSEQILNTFGLEKAERKPWNISFSERLFSGRLKQYFKTVLSQEDLKKIKINSELM